MEERRPFLKRKESAVAPTRGDETDRISDEESCCSSQEAAVPVKKQKNDSKSDITSRSGKSREKEGDKAVLSNLNSASSASRPPRSSSSLKESAAKAPKDKEKEKEKEKEKDKRKAAEAKSPRVSSLSSPNSSVNALALLPAELLCRILAFADPIDLVKLQITCKFWRDLIAEDYVWKSHLDDPMLLYYSASPLTHSAEAKRRYFKCMRLHEHWEDNTFEQINLRAYHRPVKHLRLDNATGLLASASDNVIELQLQLCAKIFLIECTLEVWAMNETVRGVPRKHRSIRTHLSTIRCFDFDEGNLVYPFGVRWSDLQLFDVQNERMISHWSAESVLQGSVDAVAMKKGVVIAGGTNAVAWDIETKEPITSFPVQRRGTVNCIQYLPESNLVALSHKGKKVRTYDLRSAKRVATVSGHNHLIHSFRLNDDTMATCSKDRTARVWDVRMGFGLRTVLIGHTDSIHALHLDSWRLLTGGRDREVRLWDLRGDARTSMAAIESPEPVFTLAANESSLVTGAMHLRLYDFTPKEKEPAKASPKSFVDRMIALACGWDENDRLERRAEHEQ